MVRQGSVADFTAVFPNGVIDPHFNDIGMEGNELLHHTVGLRGGGRAIDMREAGGFWRHGAFDTKPIDGRV